MPGCQDARMPGCQDAVPQATALGEAGTGICSSIFNVGAALSGGSQRCRLQCFLPCRMLGKLIVIWFGSIGPGGNQLVKCKEQ